jgi:DNA-binding GntR family transcriptional regulator
MYSIRTNIVNGIFPPGHKLVTQDISDELGISRTPVVSAINRLIAEGIAESIPRRGTFVAQISSQKILDMLDVRNMIEFYSIKPAIENVASHPEIITKMQTLVNEFDLNNHDKFDYKTIGRADFDFHTMFVSLTGNEQLMRIYASNLSASMPYYILRVAGIPLDRIKGALDAHSKIIDSLLKKDEYALKEILTKALLEINNIFLSLLSENHQFFGEKHN